MKNKKIIDGIPHYDPTVYLDLKCEHEFVTVPSGAGMWESYEKLQIPYLEKCSKCGGHGKVWEETFIINWD